MVVADYQRAGIALRTSEGIADFHALRTTAINVILAQGAQPSRRKRLPAIGPSI